MIGDSMMVRDKNMLVRNENILMISESFLWSMLVIDDNM